MQKAAGFVQSHRGGPASAAHAYAADIMGADAADATGAGAIAELLQREANRRCVDWLATRPKTLAHGQGRSLL